MLDREHLAGEQYQTQPAQIDLVQLADSAIPLKEVDLA